MSEPEPSPLTRREWISAATRYAVLGGVVSLSAWLVRKPYGKAAAGCGQAPTCDECGLAAGCRRPQLWQIDPNVCVACGKCQTNCVLDESAVKAVNCFALCGYCDVCTGYFSKNEVLDTGAENQLCPTGAITRKFIETQGSVRFFEYTILEELCIACGKCVVGCRQMNGSLYLQVRHDRCLNCNECAIAVGCPTQAFRRVPAGKQGLLRREAQAAVEAQSKKQHSGLPAADGGAGKDSRHGAQQ
jgi:electron transport complex protein RnfB